MCLKYREIKPCWRDSMICSVVGGIAELSFTKFAFGYSNNSLHGI